MLAIDGWGGLTEANEDANDLLMEIASRGPALGVHTELAAHGADVGLHLILARRGQNPDLVQIARP